MNPQMLENNKWVDAKDEPYYPNWFERFTHLLGFHWYYESDRCVICNYPKEQT